ncbi:hypothetical protein A2Y99_04990 [Candidatus Gottesmanbacteria bacterium RBG_13_37_7]|uniref:Probable transcriptional regulatory protein A2Y99_04990 n=1 Tax=Candidatus Gottesmanbacteria bacterium RBG_13_37_7 TaxID=1798369 RepID=A0A1F5YG49_9BACT|nr:MAG: hypothetical protein A2Y99_04990 [Candidatus Gottesmanbacteria bacterium RBG_13_37_7]
MSGHSKWSKIKHQKASTDKTRGLLFTKITSAIILSVKESGGNTDPDSNFKLRLAIEKAKSINMPKENIERAIERGKGTGTGANLEHYIYEVFGPKGIGILVEVASDNKQRTVALVKNVLDRHGGILAATGAVSYMFDLVGLISIQKKDRLLDDVMALVVDAGAIDIEDTKETFDVYTKPADLHRIKEEIEKNHLTVNSYELFYRPKLSVPITDSSTASQILKLLSSLEELEEVQRVSANFDIPDEYINDH